MNHDPSQIIGNPNGIDPQLKAIWGNRRVVDPRTGRRVLESFVKDQHGNHFITYSCVLKDGETYMVGEWIKPSTIQIFCGFCTELFDSIRARAFRAFQEKENTLP